MYYFYHHSYFILVFSNPQIISKVKDKKKKSNSETYHIPLGELGTCTTILENTLAICSPTIPWVLYNVYIYILLTYYIPPPRVPIYQEKWRHHVARTEFTTNLAPALKLIFTFRIFILIQIFHNSYTVNILYCIISTHNSYLHKLI